MVAAADKLIVGIGHRKQQGKDTFAAMLLDGLKKRGVSAVRIGFADALKDVTAALFGVDRAAMDGSEEQKNAETSVTLDELQCPNAGKGRATVRQLLQFFGTERCKAALGNDVWVNAFARRVAVADAPVVIATDVRFSSEFCAIRKDGGILIRVDRTPPPDRASVHASESALLDIAFDYVVDNRGNLDHLREKAASFCDLIVARLAVKSAEKGLK